MREINTNKMRKINTNKVRKINTNKGREINTNKMREIICYQTSIVTSNELSIKNHIKTKLPERMVMNLWGWRHLIHE